MPYQPRVTVVFDHTAQVAKRFEQEAAQLRHETALRIRDRASEAAPKDTEALSVSAYVVDERGSGYTEAVAAALGKNEDAEMAPEVAAEPNTSIISFAVAYAELNELYTGPMNPGAHPFLGPASEAERPAFDAAVRRLGR